MKKNSTLDLIAVILLLIGGLNWGFIGFFDYNLILDIFGMGIARIIFILVGLSALYRIVIWARAKGSR